MQIARQIWVSLIFLKHVQYAHIIALLCFTFYLFFCNILSGYGDQERAYVSAQMGFCIKESHNPDGLCIVTEAKIVSISGYTRDLIKGICDITVNDPNWRDLDDWILIISVTESSEHGESPKSLTAFIFKKR